ncbi:hypothetical protein OD350_28580 (plasmid) [Clostridium beijerinckii]|uniref:hypothetical protein n=1 Tax=Clostridium beijerinckii TaxID=1520 RepID=UPI00222778F0|nr:hypothetical protein [Clostridium beijerinckii]UYZ39030.1 hypothetical protein OD350_28580 [Clostridium beijerinckii]
MKIKIIKWKPMSWYWLIREELEGQELEVIRAVESALYKGKMAYLIKEPDKYVPAKNCEVVKS